MSLLDILYPPRCVYCYNILGLGGPKFVCDICNKELTYLTDNVCAQCGRPLDDDVMSCDDCRRRRFYFSRNYALFAYEGNVRNAMHRFKYKNKARYAQYFGIIAGNQFKEFFEVADIITEVPLHKRKLKIRGYNQSELLAAEIAKSLNITHVKNVLQRTRTTKAQSKVPGFIARENNVKNAFALSNICEVKGKKFIIIDDIYTTGSTLNECAKILLNNGAESVDTFSLTITIRHFDNNAIGI